MMTDEQDVRLTELRELFKVFKPNATDHAVGLCTEYILLLEKENSEYLRSITSLSTRLADMIITQIKREAR